MKKIIVLGMFLISYAYPILSSQDNPFFALICTGIVFACAKEGMEKIQKIVYEDVSKSFAISHADLPEINDQNKKDDTVLKSNTSRMKKIIDAIPASLPISHNLSSISPNKPLSVRGLRDAIRDEVYVGSDYSPNSVVDVDEINQTSVTNLVKTQVPFFVQKKDAIRLSKEVIAASTLSNNPSIDVDQKNIVITGLRAASPDDYDHIDSLTLSPRGLSRHDDQEEEGYIVIREK